MSSQQPQSLAIPDFLRREEKPMNNKTSTMERPKAKPKSKAHPEAEKKPTETTAPAKKAGTKKIPLDKFGYREGSIKSKAAALYGSKSGATFGEVKDKLGSNQLNLLTELGNKGFTIKRVKEKGKSDRQVTRYFIQ